MDQDLVPAHLHPASSTPRRAWLLSLQSSLRLRITKITANIQRLIELTDQLRTPKDFVVVNSTGTLALRVVQSTSVLAKEVREDLKKLSDAPFVRYREYALDRITKDFLFSLTAFQQAHQAFAEAMRGGDSITGDDHTSDDDSSELDVAGIVFEPQTFPRDFVKNRNSSQEHEDDVLKVGEALPEMAEMLEGLDALVEEVTEEIHPRETLERVVLFVALVICGLGFLYDTVFLVIFVQLITGKNR